MVYYIIIGILVGLVSILSYLIINLLTKVEKYQDITINQTAYLQDISNIITDSQKHLNTLDEKGVFQADDEVGEFFKQMQAVQAELNKYMLPENYGKEKIQS